MASEERWTLNDEKRAYEEGEHFPALFLANQSEMGYKFYRIVF